MGSETDRGSSPNDDDEPWSSIQLPKEKRDRLRNIRDSNGFGSYHELIDKMIHNTQEDLSK
jgi:hypothetical protein